MSPRRTSSWPAGAPSWIDVSTPDLDAAQAFYGPLLGWTFGERAEEFDGYCMCEVDGVPAAGMGRAQPGALPAWTLYFATDDAAAGAAAITAHGGTVVHGPAQVGDAGTMVVATDVSGAPFGLWQGDQHIGLGIFSEQGGLCWEDLRSTDADEARAFYSGVLGWTYAAVPMAGPDYTTYHRAGDEAPLGGLGGMMGMDGFAPHWIVYLGVPDVDASVAYVETNGGHVVSPGFDTPFGRMAAVADPFGASFWIMPPADDQPAPDRGD